jgi:hypothetical protein
MMRRHAIFHILCVIFCLAINGFCFWISERMNDQQTETRSKRGKKIDVSFDVSYYLVVLASTCSIMATAFTLIRRYPSDEDEQIERLIEEYNNFDEPLLNLERSLPSNANVFGLNPISSCQNNVAADLPPNPYASVTVSDQALLPQMTRSNHGRHRHHRSSNSRHNRHVQRPSEQPPPPPQTPPPPLINLEVPLNESPPPYCSTSSINV